MTDQPPIVLTRVGDPSPGSAVTVPWYRIPALAVTTTGRILVAWDVRVTSVDLPGPFDLAVRSSDDDGQSWSSPRLIRAHRPALGDQPEVGYGDPSLLVDPQTGRIFCFHVSSTGKSFWDAEPGPDGDGLRQHLSYSDDDGQTWQHRDLTRELKPDLVEGMFASSGNGIALGAGSFSGRLLQPFVVRIGDARFAAVAHSDDHGTTWRLGDLIGPDCDESKVVELGDGAVLNFARARPRRKLAKSLDGGISFDQPTPHAQLVDPACNGGAIRLRDGRLVVSGLDDESQRRRLVVRVSQDDGLTWAEPLVVEPGPAVYSVLAELPDGSVGLVYERGYCEEIVWTRLSRSSLALASSSSRRTGAETVSSAST